MLFILLFLKIEFSFFDESNIMFWAKARVIFVSNRFELADRADI